MLTLGIDYGTTKNAVVLYDTEHPGDYIAASAPHGAELKSDRHPEVAQQDMGRVYQAILALIQSLPEERRRCIDAVGFTGQMHSVVAWNDSELSPVVTWQDKRSSASGRLKAFRQQTGLPLADGFGGVTLAEWAAEGELKRWNHVASPVDWLAMTFAKKDRPFMEPTFAASWGIWKLHENRWNTEALEKLGIPEELLPATVDSGSIVGATRGVPGLPDGIPIVASLGDNQASVLGTADAVEEEIFLTLGTGAQLSVVVDKKALPGMALPPEVELRPFLNGNFLAVNAPLCGGKAWAWLGNTINSFLVALGVPPVKESLLLDKLDALACEATESSLVVEPDFLGRRNAPELRGSIAGIDLGNFTLPALAQALASGIVRQLYRPFPKELLAEKRAVVGSGNCVRLCRSIQREAATQAGLPLRLCAAREEAALGAAKLAAEQGRENALPGR